MINTDQNQLPGDNSADIPSIIYRDWETAGVTQVTQ